MGNSKLSDRLSVFFIMGISCIIASSCFRMSYSTKGASVPVEAKTVSVQYVENQAPTTEPGLSQQLTNEIKDYIQRNSNLTLVTGTGDIDFEATITGYDIRPVAIVSGDVAAQNKFTISMKVKFTCDVKPEIDYESSFSRSETYDSNLDFSQIKEEKTEEILKLLIEDIYNRAFVNW